MDVPFYCYVFHQVKAAAYLPTMILWLLSLLMKCLALWTKGWGTWSLLGPEHSHVTQTDQWESFLDMFMYWRGEGRTEGRDQGFLSLLYVTNLGLFKSKLPHTMWRQTICRRESNEQREIEKEGRGEIERSVNLDDRKRGGKDRKISQSWWYFKLWSSSFTSQLHPPPPPPIPPFLTLIDGLYHIICQEFTRKRVATR